jgi:hypothetical protein
VDVSESWPPYLPLLFSNPPQLILFLFGFSFFFSFDGGASCYVAVMSSSCGVALCLVVAVVDAGSGWPVFSPSLLDSFKLTASYFALS